MGGGGKKNTLVLAGGAVLYRETDGVTQCAIVHRRRYDDWSLPKGKVDPGESLPVTAVREIAEETGSDCVLGRRLGTTGYPLKAGARKEVTYWAARAVGGDFSPNSEVDELRWVPVDEASGLVSYALDRRILAGFTESAPPRHQLVVVRHARAGSRSDWKGDDADRPLDKTGRAQAEMLAPMLRAFGVRRLASAPLVRCEQTVGPLADELGVDVASEPALSDSGHAADPEAAMDRLLELAAAEETTAVCSQGGAIPELVGRLAERSGLDLPDTSTRKSGVWVLGVDEGRATHADYYPSPMPVR